jgi:hypothetical protein
MKKLMIAALLLGQPMAGLPAVAADFDRDAVSDVGAFGGVRVRLPLDGDPRNRRLHAGLAFAPTIRSRTPEGETRLQIGQGLELAAGVRTPVRLSLGGQDLRRLAAQSADEDGGIPTWAIVAGGVVLVLGIGLLAFTEAMNASSE